MPHNMPMQGVAILVAGIVLGSFISEDATTLAAATLGTTHMLSWPVAFLSAFVGTWASDLTVYAALKGFGGPFSRWISKRMQLETKTVRPSRSAVALAISRFVPGSRLPAYAGVVLLKLPFRVFAAVTSATAALGIVSTFIAFQFLPHQSEKSQRNLVMATSLIVVAMMALPFFGPALSRLKVAALRAWTSIRAWEFWPAWLFYLPVGAICAWLSARYGSIALPTAANPGQHNGGVIGESKAQILQELMKVAPGFTAAAFLIPSGSLPERMNRFRTLLENYNLSYPCVLKPDAAQRGSGFRMIHDEQEAEAYLVQVPTPVVLQRYVEGPREAGIFYYRFPGESQGQIFSITRKEFPIVTGDGVHTLEELIRQDTRASRLANTYLRRFSKYCRAVVPPGVQLRLVEAGNHCQGCIFRNGGELYSEPLRRTIDEIAKRLPGFFIGRFDIRYGSEEQLREGRNFTILELNGAASEATDIYDERNSLWKAYCTLYHQWNLVYAIGSENRKRGNRPRPAWKLWRDWREVSHQAATYPLAD